MTLSFVYVQFRGEIAIMFVCDEVEPTTWLMLLSGHNRDVVFVMSLWMGADKM